MSDEDRTMAVEKFEAVLDAGAELFDALRDIVRRYGLETDDAPAVLSVALAGVFTVSPVPHHSFQSVVDVSTQMWRKEGDGGTLDSLEFDPPHRAEERLG